VNQNRVIIILAAIVVVLGLGYLAYTQFGASAEAELASADVMTADSALEKELLVPGPLGDMTMGKKDAPVVVIEYSSMTCPHCADFNSQTFPELKKTYIDTGKVYFISRPFPFDSAATAAFMLAFCAGPERYFGFIDVLFEQQRQWVLAKDPMAALEKIARQGGFSNEQFQQCMKNGKVFDHISKVAKRAAEKFEVRSTPTFFINGQMAQGFMTWSQFQPLIEKALKGEDITKSEPEGETTPQEKAPGEE
jgi:protein-disulfide isomerase